MISHYLEFVFLFIGIYMTSRAAPNPYSMWVGAIAGVFVIVLSIIKLFGA